MTCTRYRDKLAQLEEGSLDPEDFSHRDHVGVAVEALLAYGFFDAAARYANGLQALTERAGVPEKFNATITFASMSLIAERMQTSGIRDAEGFLLDCGDMFSVPFLTKQYPADRVGTDLARMVPLLPADQFTVRVTAGQTR